MKENASGQTYQKPYAAATPRPRATERSSQSLFLSFPVIGAMGIVDGGCCGASRSETK